MSLWHKRAGVSNIKIQPIRAQLQQTSTNERSGTACLDGINFLFEDLVEGRERVFQLRDIPRRGEIVQHALAEAPQTGHVLRSVQPGFNVAICKGRKVSIDWCQCGPLDIEIISEEFIVMLRQLSYAIKNQLKAPKAPY